MKKLGNDELIKQLRLEKRVLKAENKKLAKTNSILCLGAKCLIRELETASMNIEEQKEKVRTIYKMFATIAHDLRAPFFPLKGFTELLESRYNQMTTDKRKKQIHLIRLQTNTVYELVENLLYWSSMQVNKRSIALTNLSVKTLCDRVINQLQTVANEKKVIIVNNVSEQSMAHTSASIEIVFRNLISNAIKFTNPGGIVTIALSELNEQPQISITDTGIGMGQEDMEKLFKEFHSTPGTHNEQGTGLGLMLCKDLVENHGGTISVESKVGEGTTFMFTLRPELKTA